MVRLTRPCVPWPPPSSLGPPSGLILPTRTTDELAGVLPGKPDSGRLGSDVPQALCIPAAWKVNTRAAGTWCPPPGPSRKMAGPHRSSSPGRGGGQKPALPPGPPRSQPGPAQLEGIPGNMPFPLPSRAKVRIFTAFFRGRPAVRLPPFPPFSGFSAHGPSGAGVFFCSSRAPTTWVPSRTSGAEALNPSRTDHGSPTPPQSRFH